MLNKWSLSACGLLTSRCRGGNPFPPLHPFRGGRRPHSSGTSTGYHGVDSLSGCCSLGSLALRCASIPRMRVSKQKYVKSRGPSAGVITAKARCGEIIVACVSGLTLPVACGVYSPDPTAAFTFSGE
jgi:hypothetical protein